MNPHFDEGILDQRIREPIAQGAVPASRSISSTISQARRTSHTEIVSWSYSWPKSRISTSRQSLLKYVEWVWLFDHVLTQLASVGRIPDACLVWSRRFPRGKESKYRRTCNRPDVSEPERLGTRICMFWWEHVKHQISKIAWELGGWLSHSWIDLCNAEHDMGTIVEVLQTVLKW